MLTLNERIRLLKERIDEKSITIMILGFGSVGQYLFDYLMSTNDISFNIIIVGRNHDKMESDVNIVKIASLIRNLNKSKITIRGNCDFENVQQISDVIDEYKPDFIINSSRVYSGLKYGSLSWNNLRAYGIWSPLAIHFIRNIMYAYEKVNSNAIVINTSYSDAVIPWLKSANVAYPDFGSGNLNHLVPRIKYSVAELLNLNDFWNIDVFLATSHFHDVVISKEGHCEGLEPLLNVFYNNKKVKLNITDILSKCKLSMPVDSKRNMMNASSNFEIIISIITALREEKQIKFHSPGAMGNIGGYPVLINGKEKKVSIDESNFSLTMMKELNRKSIALDGIEDINSGTLVYTDKLIKSVKEAFNVNIPKSVHFDEIDQVSSFIIDNIIKPNT